MTDHTPPQQVTVPEDALSPREQRIFRAAGVLRWGAVLHGVLLYCARIGRLSTG